MGRANLILIFFLFFAATFSAHADGFRHMVSFGTQGLGWSAAAEKIDSENGSDYDGVDSFVNGFAFNYSYLFSRRLQLGGFFSMYDQEYNFRKTDGGGSTSEIEASNLGIITIYNFSDDTLDAYFIGAGISLFNYAEENSRDFQNSEGKAPFELDDRGLTYELVFGKRFSLLRWNIDHLTFAPQIGFFHRSHGKDFSDQKISDGFGLYINLIKFDFFF